MHHTNSGLGYNLDPRFSSLLTQSVYTTTTEIDVQYYSTSISARPCTTAGALQGSDAGTAPVPSPVVSNRRLLVTKQAPNRRLLDQAAVAGQEGAADPSSLIRLPVSYMDSVLTNETTAPGVKVSTKPLRIIVPYA